MKYITIKDISKLGGADGLLLVEESKSGIRVCAVCKQRPYAYEHFYKCDVCSYKVHMYCGKPMPPRNIDFLCKTCDEPCSL